MSASGLNRGLYAVTDAQLLPDDRIVEAVEAALTGGAVLIQYRDKSSTDTQRHAIAASLRDCCHNHGRPLIINDDPQLAHRVGADGVHLGDDDLPIGEARRLLGPEALIGRSCHGSLAAGEAAAAEGASYLAFGRFFSSQTKAGAPGAEPSVLTQAAALGLPRVAIGGITVDNAPELIDAGADLVAVVHGLFSADDIEARAREFTRLFHQRLSGEQL